MKNEAALQRKIQQYLKARGVYCNKNQGGPTSRGRPDLEGCYCGLYWALEVKMPGRENTLTDHQAHSLASIKEAGGYAEVATSTEDARIMLKHLDKLRR